MSDVTGTLYIISAPSGAGKTSLVKALLQVIEHITVSVSHTTRPSRVGETDGVDYHFVDKSTFEGLLNNQQFLEHAQVFDNYYGTAQKSVETLLNQGTDVILEIDWQGAEQVRKIFTEAVGVFILPPSRAELEQRLQGRGQDSEAIIQRRMRDAVNEMCHYAPFDYLVINDDFETALSELQAIVQTQRLRMSVQSQRQASLLAELIKI